MYSVYHSHVGWNQPESRWATYRLQNAHVCVCVCVCVCLCVRLCVSALVFTLGFAVRDPEGSLDVEVVQDEFVLKDLLSVSSADGWCIPSSMRETNVLLNICRSRSGCNFCEHPMDHVDAHETTVLRLLNNFKTGSALGYWKKSMTSIRAFL